MDRRAGAALAGAVDRLGGPSVGAERIRAVSGANADPSHGAPKIAGCARTSAGGPMATSSGVVSVVAHLTGRRTVDRPCLVPPPVGLASGRWSDELCAAFAIDRACLGEILPATDIAGTLGPELRRGLGVPAWPVVVGTGDEHAACVAADILRPGRIGDISGTAEPVAAASATPVRDPAGLSRHTPTRRPDRWLVEHPGSVGRQRPLAGGPDRVRRGGCRGRAGAA